jgi:hypothetical protein
VVLKGLLLAKNNTSAQCHRTSGSDRVYTDSVTLYGTGMSVWLFRWHVFP